MIRINGLHKFFNRGRQNEIHVINDVSLDLPEKGMVAVFGKSGCGKTTLLNVIGGLDSFAAGSLTVGGEDIRKHTDVIRNRDIGYIFQNYNLSMGETCFDNVADALRLCGMRDAEQIHNRVMMALSNVGMDRYARRTPDTLSGGQQQRIAIARAIVKNPRIILADEPTGNLDETNTVLIMDLLKAISKDHLVVLVTHEANLVDYYCDTVIELSDGKVVGVRQNDAATGVSARNKNDVFLGELEHTRLCNETAEIEYYGEKPDTPIRLTIVHNDGKYYLQIGTEKIQVLDHSSEVRLREGVYKEEVHGSAVEKRFDMEALPPVTGNRFGRLFSFASSLKMGFEANFTKRKKGKKLLRTCLILFSVIVVIMSAVFGTSIRELSDIRKSYNHNVFYLATPNAAVSQKLAAGIGAPESGIDSIRLHPAYFEGDERVSFRPVSFETFFIDPFRDNLETNAVFLDAALAGSLPLVTGKGAPIAEDEMLITSCVAEQLLKNSPYGFIQEPEDLIGMTSDSVWTNGKALHIVGIVESDETAVYLNEIMLAKNIYNAVWLSRTARAADYGFSTLPGEVVLAVRESESGLPALNQSIQILGRTVRVTDIRYYGYSYSDWLKNNQVKKLFESEYYTQSVSQKNPTLVQGTPAFAEAYEKAKEEEYCLYLAYLYDKEEEYMRDRLMFDADSFECWLYVNKEIPHYGKLILSNSYYNASVYKDRYGRYPTRTELTEWIKTQDSETKLSNSLYERYSNEYDVRNSVNCLYENTFLLSDADYVAGSCTLGETHASARKPDVKKNNGFYTLIHSVDPAKTKEWLRTEFSDLSAPNGRQKAMIMPDDLFDEAIKAQYADILGNLIAMGVILILMSLCMFFIMRSSLMNRIKEVGIYRAIGVSKKNMVFRFLIESAVLATLTVLVGYLCSSAFLLATFSLSSLIESVFFYPMWMALLILALLYSVSLFFGVLPVLLLLRKTPSEILAKYDI